MGFFNLETFDEKNRALEYSCETCPAQNRVLKDPTNLDTDVLILSDYLSEKEVERKNLCNLREVESIVDDYELTYISLAAIPCTFNTKKPSKKLLRCCRSRLEDILERTTARLVFVCGDAAIDALYKEQTSFPLSSHTLSKYVSEQNRFNARIAFIPSLQKVKESFSPVGMLDYESMIKKAIETMDGEMIEDVHSNRVVLCDTVDDLASKITSKKPLVFDYETTGIKPQYHLHRLLCVGISQSANTAYSCLLTNKKDSKKLKELFRDLDYEYQKNWDFPLYSKELVAPVGFEAHNSNYEWSWTKEKLDLDIRSWGWDSMLVAHYLDNRPGTKSLKFQAFARFGILDYDSEMKSYMKKVSVPVGGSNDLNSLEYADPCKLLTYCGMDALLEYILGEKQKKELNYA